MRVHTLNIIALVLFVAGAAASHNDLDVRSGFDNQITYETYNVGYGSYNLNKTVSSGMKSMALEVRVRRLTAACSHSIWGLRYCEVLH